MKKHKILVVALAMAVMLVGSGYAYWTQTLTIDNTVTTGNMNVSFVDPATVNWETTNHLDPWNRHSNLVTVGYDIPEGGQKIDFTVGNFYPGAGASLGFIVQNTGSVAAKITDVTGLITQNTALCNAFNYQFNKVEVVDLFGIPVAEYIINVPANNVSDLAAGLEDALDGIIIQPTQSIVLKASGTWFPGDEQVANPGYEIFMPSSITGDQFEGQTAKFSLAFAFEQVN